MVNIQSIAPQPLKYQNKQQKMQIPFSGLPQETMASNTIGTEKSAKSLPKNFTAAELAGMIQAGGVQKSNLAPPAAQQNFSKVRAQHILLETEQEASDIKHAIKSGILSFEDAAAQYSQCPSGQKGGDLGFFSKGDMVKPFSDAAFEAMQGEVVGPVKTQFGYHLIKTVEKKA
jgi:peptidyl-prolyl cis-trans isomerase C